MITAQTETIKFSRFNVGFFFTSTKQVLVVPLSKGIQFVLKHIVISLTLLKLF